MMKSITRIIISIILYQILWAPTLAYSSAEETKPVSYAVAERNGKTDKKLNFNSLRRKEAEARQFWEDHQEYMEAKESLFNTINTELSANLFGSIKSLYEKIHADKPEIERYYDEIREITRVFTDIPVNEEGTPVFTNTNYMLDKYMGEDSEQLNKISEFVAGVEKINTCITSPIPLKKCPSVKTSDIGGYFTGMHNINESEDGKVFENIKDLLASAKKAEMQYRDLSVKYNKRVRAYRIQAEEDIIDELAEYTEGTNSSCGMLNVKDAASLKQPNKKFFSQCFKKHHPKLSSSSCTLKCNNNACLQECFHDAIEQETPLKANNLFDIHIEGDVDSSEIERSIYDSVTQENQHYVNRDIEADDEKYNEDYKGHLSVEEGIIASDETLMDDKDINDLKYYAKNPNSFYKDKITMEKNSTLHINRRLGLSELKFKNNSTVYIDRDEGIEVEEISPYEVGGTLRGKGKIRLKRTNPRVPYTIRPGESIGTITMEIVEDDDYFLNKTPFVIEIKNSYEAGQNASKAIIKGANIWLDDASFTFMPEETEGTFYNKRLLAGQQYDVLEKDSDRSFLGDLEKINGINKTNDINKFSFETDGNKLQAVVKSDFYTLMLDRQAKVIAGYIDEISSKLEVGSDNLSQKYKKFREDYYNASTKDERVALALSFNSSFANMYPKYIVDVFEINENLSADVIYAVSSRTDNFRKYSKVNKFEFFADVKGAYKPGTVLADQFSSHIGASYLIDKNFYAGALIQQARESQVRTYSDIKLRSNILTGFLNAKYNNTNLSFYLGLGSNKYNITRSLPIELINASYTSAPLGQNMYSGVKFKHSSHFKYFSFNFFASSDYVYAEINPHKENSDVADYKMGYIKALSYSNINLNTGVEFKITKFKMPSYMFIPSLKADISVPYSTDYEQTSGVYFTQFSDNSFDLDGRTLSELNKELTKLNLTLDFRFITNKNFNFYANFKKQLYYFDNGFEASNDAKIFSFGIIIDL